MEWVEHLAKRGNVVIFPVYQGFGSQSFLDNTVFAVKEAIEYLINTPGHVIPQLDNAAVVGHSAGGMVTANLAAIAANVGLPIFKAVMCVAPGITPFMHTEDYRDIPNGTLLLCVVGDKDILVGVRDAKTIYTRTTNIPLSDKDFIVVRSDKKRLNWITANHFACLCPNSTNTLDFYGYWKLFDGLCDAAFYGTNREYALGNTNKQTYMGTWSDGEEFTRLLVGF